MNITRIGGLAAVTLCSAALLVGCGGGNSVVTVTTTETHVETIANASAIPNQMTASDEKIATLVRDQADEVESLSTDLANGSLKTDPQGTYTRVSMLQAGLTNASLVGVSPCMQEVEQQWEVTSQKFFDLFSMLQGAIPDVAVATGKRFTSGRPLGDDTDHILSSLATCISSLAGSAGESDSASSGGAAGSGTVKQVDCVGAEEACSLKIPIGGGVSNQAYEVALTGTNLGEPTITPDTATDEGAYDLSGAKFTTGGSIYSFTLDSVQSLPEGAYITLDFATKK